VAEAVGGHPGEALRGLATDGGSLFYTTGGAGFASAPGLFRVPLTGGTPARLVDTAGDGGQVVVDAAFVTWAEPAEDRIVRIPRP
jgi:hypothetical protein